MPWRPISARSNDERTTTTLTTYERPYGPQMSEVVQNAWEQMRTLLEEMTRIVKSLSKEDAKAVEALMEEWMGENPI